MLIPNKRAFLAGCLAGAGVLRLLERFAARPGLLVLTYHRIGHPAANGLYAPVVSATPEALRAQIRALRRSYQVLTLEEATEAAESGFRLERPSALVTFDDGTRDNAEVAAPLLRAEGVPAAFFLSTALIDRPRLPWYDHVAVAVNTSRVRTLRLERPEPLTFDLSKVGRAAAVARVVLGCLAIDIDVNDEAGVLAHIEERAGVSVDPIAKGQELFMSWDDARGLVASGMSVGSHAHTHRKLAALPARDQLDELVVSRSLLEKHLRQEVTALAYPYGWPGTFNGLTERRAREAGYRVAFSSAEGVNRPGDTNPFAARRLNIGSGDSPSMVRARLALWSALGRSPV